MPFCGLLSADDLRLILGEVPFSGPSYAALSTLPIGDLCAWPGLCREVTRLCYDLNFVVPRSWLECIVKCQRMVIGDLVLLEKILSQKAGDQSADRIVAGREFMLL